MKKLYLTLIAIAFTSCATPSPHKWDIPNLGKVVCHGGAELKECGLWVYGCTESKSVDVGCLSGAVYLGPGEYFEPEIYDEPGK